MDAADSDDGSTNSGTMERRQECDNRRDTLATVPPCGTSTDPHDIATVFTLSAKATKLLTATLTATLTAANTATARPAIHIDGTHGNNGHTSTSSVNSDSRDDGARGATTTADTHGHNQKTIPG